MKIFKKKPKRLKSKKTDYSKIQDIIKALNNKKTTVEDVMNGLQEMVWGFQTLKEDYYLKELEEQFENGEIDGEDFNTDAYIKQLEEQIMIDSANFVNEYVTKMEDQILDSINELQIKKNSAHAFLLLLQNMKKAFSDIK